MSAPTQYGPPNGQPQSYGPQAGPPNGQPQSYGPQAGPPQGQPQYNGPQSYGPPAGQPQQGYGPPAGQPGQTAVGSGDDSGFFDGASGSPSLNFGGKGRGYGEWHGGIYTGVIKKQQARNYDTKKPDFWDSGDPIIDVIVELLTQERDGNNPLDDGRRRLFVTQKDTNIPDSMASVVKEATRNGFSRGGQLYCRKVSTRRGEKSDRNVWEAVYTPPTPETLAILDALPPQGVSQQAADEVAAQASYTQPAQSGAQQGPPPSYAGAPAASNQWGPSGPQDPGQQYGPPQGQPGYPQQYGPPHGQQDFSPPGPAGPQYPQQRPGYPQPPAGQPSPGGQNPWAGQPAPQHGQPHQTQNPYQQ